jgi:hypothetical protein
VPEINIQTFSPRKIIDKQSVFVSPIKTYQAQAQRPKLVFSFGNSTYKVCGKSLLRYLCFLLDCLFLGFR